MRRLTLVLSCLLIAAASALANTGPPVDQSSEKIQKADAAANLTDMVTKEATAPVPISVVGDNCGDNCMKAKDVYLLDDDSGGHYANFTTKTAYRGDTKNGFTEKNCQKSDMRASYDATATTGSEVSHAANLSAPGGHFRSILLS